MPSFSSLLALVALASASATASAASCNLAALVPLLVDPRNDACLAASGVAFPPPQHAAPTADAWAKTCAVEACVSLYSDLLDAAPSECAIGALGVHADIVNMHRAACGLPLAGDAAAGSTGASSSGSLDRDAIKTADLLTPEPTTPEPTTPAPKRNSTMVVEALTNAAPSARAASSLVAVGVSAFAAAVATFVL